MEHTLQGGKIERIGKERPPIDTRGGLIQTGIRSLDQKLGLELSSRKGIPTGSMIVISYPSETVIPKLFVQRILLNWAQDVERNIVFYIHSALPFELVKRSFQAYRWNIEPFINKSLFFEDMYNLRSATMGTALKLGRIEIRRRTYVKKIIERMKHVKKTQNKNCFSLFDDLLWMKEDELDEDPTALILFLKDMVRSFTEIGGVHFLLLPQDILDPVAERIIMNAAQGIFYFSRNTVGSKIKDNFAITKLMGVAYISETLELTPSEVEGFKIESTSKI